MKMIRRCRELAEETLKDNSNDLGIIAGREWYRDIWGRDALISCLGMSASGSDTLQEISARCMDTLSVFQKDTGQMPNKISPDGKKRCFGEGGCVDSSMWYPIAVWSHYKNTEDKEFLRSHEHNALRAVRWARCLDVNNDLLLETPEGSDWNDLLLRSGRTLYCNTLYYSAMRCVDLIHGELGSDAPFGKEAEKTKEMINIFFWPKRENLGHVRKLFGFTGVDKDFETLLSERQTRHYFADVGFRKYDPRFDSFGNILAMLSGIADDKQRLDIFRHIKSERIAEPYPIRALHPPIREDDPFRAFYFRWTEHPSLAKPGNYHNGGIWPFIGGFYVASLNSEERQPQLKRLAEANMTGKNEEFEFNEWLSAEGRPEGSAFQSWSAGMFILAHEAAKKSGRFELF